MSIAPESDRPNDWWYQKDGEPRGPVSHAEIRELVDQGDLSPDTLVWNAAYGDTWRPHGNSGLPATGLANATDDPAWQKSFAKFDAADGFVFQWSWLGFIFGPFYYFYLRLWRKGLVIVGLSIFLSFSLDVVLTLFGAKSPSWIGFVTSAFCGMYVKYDFYRFRRVGELIWPRSGVFRSNLAVGAIYLASAAVAGIGAFIDASLAQPTAAAIPHRKTDYRQTSASPVENKNSAGTSQLIPLDQAIRVCQDYLQQRYGGEYSNKYDDTAKYTLQVTVNGGVVYRNPYLFGGRQYLSFSATMTKYLNGDIQSNTNVPDTICVLTDDGRVIDTEISDEAGRQ